MRRFRRIAEGIAVAGIVLALAGCIRPVTRTPSTPVPAAQTETATTVLEYAVDLSDDAMTAPSELPAGLRSVTVNNTGQEWHAAIFRRLNADVTMEQFTAAFQENPFGSLPLTTQLGGPDVAPGESIRGVYQFEPGAYILVDNWTTPPRFTTFTVVESTEADVQPPLASITVEMKEHEFVMPATIAAGTQWWQFTNSGEHLHQAGIIKLHDGKTIEDVAAWLEDEQGPPPGDEVAFWNVMSPGEQSWGELTLPAGVYWVTDGLPDPTADFASNMTLGMAKEITVTE